MRNERRVRTLFVSDVHLGCRFAQSENFLSYIERIRPERLFILGDFFDGWKLGAKWHWPAYYNRIFRRLFDLSAGGTTIHYTPGNHDAFLRNEDVQGILRRCGINIEMEDEFVFDAQDGRRFLLMHGDKFDIVETRAQWLSVAVTFAYEALLFTNWWASKLLRRENRSPYAACAVIKNAVKTGVRFFSHFEQQLYDYARRRDCDGVICGHIHTPGVFGTPEMRYLNIGDWVENCTAMVEHFDGTFHLESFFPNVPVQVIPPHRKLSTRHSSWADPPARALDFASADDNEREAEGMTV